MLLGMYDIENNYQEITLSDKHKEYAMNMHYAMNTIFIDIDTIKVVGKNIYPNLKKYTNKDYATKMTDNIIKCRVLFTMAN